LEVSLVVEIFLWDNQVWETDKLVVGNKLEQLAAQLVVVLELVVVITVVQVKLLCETQ
jgi:hypothetical protein